MLFLGGPAASGSSTVWPANQLSDSTFMPKSLILPSAKSRMPETPRGMQHAHDAVHDGGLRVDDAVHVEPELAEELTPFAKLVGPNPGDLDRHIRVCLGDQKAEKVDLVGVRLRDQHLSTCQPCLLQDVHTAGAALNNLGVKVFL